MKNLLIFSTALVLLCCVNQIFAQQTINGTIMHDNLEREYILYVPANYDASNSVPLVINFHGYTSNAQQQMFYGDFRPIADQAGFLVVQPQGTLDNTGTTHFNVGWGQSTVDDVGFTSALLDTLAAEYAINMERVYSTGMSNGGFMSYLLACELSDRIAAIASVTGSMTPNFIPCTPNHPMPVLEIHGTEDETVPYEGAIFATDIDEVVQHWVKFNNCDEEPMFEEIEDFNTSDMSTVEHYVYENGDNDVNTELFKIIGGGHTWPGTAFAFGSTNQDINASEEVWKFFDRYDINGLRETTSASTFVPRSVVEAFPNPSSGVVNLKFENAAYRNYTIYSLVGEPILEGISNADQAAIDLSEYPQGVYIFKSENKVIRLVKF